MKTNSTKPQELEKLKDKTFILNLTIGTDVIAKEYQAAIKSLQPHFKHKGFRQGKVPLDIIEKEVDPKTVLDDIASHVISHAYSEKIKQYGLKPIIQPRVQITNAPLSLDKEWQVRITGCELPEVKLNSNYKAKIKKLNKTPSLKEEERLGQILDALISSAEVDLPSILVEADVHTQLSRLIDQTNQAGITIDEYFKSKGTSLNQFKQQLETQIKRDWQINLSISQIAAAEKVEISPDQIKDYVKDKPQLQANPQLAHFLLQQQQVIDSLKKL